MPTRVATAGEDVDNGTTMTSDATGMQSRPWDLGAGTIMTVTIPNKLTKKNVERLKKYVAVLESEASITWDENADGDDKAGTGCSRDAGGDE